MQHNASSSQAEDSHRDERYDNHRTAVASARDHDSSNQSHDHHKDSLRGDARHGGKRLLSVAHREDEQHKQSANTGYERSQVYDAQPHSGQVSGLQESALPILPGCGRPRLAKVDKSSAPGRLLRGHSQVAQTANSRIMSEHRFSGEDIRISDEMNEPDEAEEPSVCRPARADSAFESLRLDALSLEAPSASRVDRSELDSASTYIDDDDSCSTSGLSAFEEEIDAADEKKADAMCQGKYVHRFVQNVLNGVEQRVNDLLRDLAPQDGDTNGQKSTSETASPLPSTSSSSKIGGQTNQAANTGTLAELQRQQRKDEDEEDEENDGRTPDNHRDSLGKEGT